VRVWGQRWLYQIIGGALIMPYVVVVTVALEANSSLVRGVLNPDPIVYAAALPLVAVTGFFPLIRTIEVPMARAFLGGPAQALDPAVRGGRLRTAVFWFMHLALGSVVSGMTLAIPPAAVLLLLMPVFGNLGWDAKPAWLASLSPVAPLAGIGLLIGLVLSAVAVGALLAWTAPRLLGPSPADRIAVLRRTAEQLAERNRLARDLHDSVGHTLSIVMVQAGAAARVLDSDPAFARQALGHIEQAARDAQAELDHVLGLLREAPRVAYLVEQVRRTGVEVTAEIDGDEARIPPEIAHDLQQIVREALTNAIRHGARGPVTLHVAVREQAAEVTVDNPMPGGPTPQTRPEGGRGLLGVRERVAAQGGRMSAGASAGRWVLTARLPFGGGR